MNLRAHGTAGAAQSLTGIIHYYTVWAASPNAFTDPINATGVNIRVTGNIQDESQKSFELLIQSIGLRVLPIILNDPIAVEALEDNGAATLTGEGFVWRFASEQRDAFATKTDPVGLLIAEVDGIVLPNGTVLRTSGIDQNIEFERSDIL
jgi:hypothetical protein